MKQDVICERLQQASGAPVGGTAGLSGEFINEVARRFAVVAGSVAVVGLLVFALNLVLSFGLGWDLHPYGRVALVHASTLGVFLMSLGFWFLALRLAGTRPHLVLDLGLVYQVLGAVLLSLAPYWGDQFLAKVPGRIGWLGVWILLFPLFVPGRLSKTVTVAFVSACMPFLVFVLWCSQAGRSLPAPQILVATFLPYFVCAALAVFPAWLSLRLSRSLCAAQREARALGSYQLVELLGEGGMGEVWRAEHRMLARPAAIKLIRSDALRAEASASARENVLARFEREARATAALRSPHTIGLYDFGVMGDGTFYYVMELLQGIDLDSLVERFGRVSPARVVHLLSQACASLAEAHRVGLIHRDIKPANLFTCRLGLELDFVKVLDFGLVRRALGADDTAATRNPNLTGEGFIVGTPAYMAPEQAAAKPVDERADIYSLGCVGYWLLTGQTVFQQDSTMHMLIDQIQTQPERPSSRLPQPLPADLEQVILCCLAKDPLQRPASAEDLAERLEACDVPAWSQAQARVWWAEHLPEALEDPAHQASSGSFGAYDSTVALPSPA